MTDSEIRTQLARLIEGREADSEKLDQLAEKQDELMRAIYVGNGKDGIMVRVDRLERAERTRARVVWVAVSATIIFAVTAFWNWIKRVKGA